MTFSRDVALAPSGDGTFAGTTDPSYRNLIGPFGGWIAGVLLSPILTEAAFEGDPISSSTTFAAAVEDGAFVVRPRCLRRNRSTQFWSSDLEQIRHGSATTCASASVALARRRVTRSFRIATPPHAPPPESLERFDPSRLGSSWLSKFDMRPVRGHPFAKDAPPSTNVVGWVREANGTTLDFATLTALCDTTFPMIFSLVRARVPISTVVMNVFFHVTRAELAAIGNDFILTEASIGIAKDGYFDERTALWSRDGRQLATTEQIVWYKAEPDAGDDEAARVTAADDPPAPSRA